MDANDGEPSGRYLLERKRSIGATERRSQRNTKRNWGDTSLQRDGRRVGNSGRHVLLVANLVTGRLFNAVPNEFCSFRSGHGGRSNGG